MLKVETPSFTYFIREFSTYENKYERKRATHKETYINDRDERKQTYKILSVLFIYFFTYNKR